MSALLIPVRRQHGEDEHVSYDYSIKDTFSSKDQKKELISQVVENKTLLGRRIACKRLPAAFIHESHNNRLLRCSMEKMSKCHVTIVNF